MLATDLRPRIGVENRLPEFIEEAMYLPQLPADLLQVLRRTSQAAVEHLVGSLFPLHAAGRVRPHDRHW